MRYNLRVKCHVYRYIIINRYLNNKKKRKKKKRKSTTYCTYFPMSITITMIAFNLRTLRRNTCLLNFISGSMYFFSLGFNVRTQALTTFHTTVISSRIWGEFPFARPLNFLSFNAYHRFSPFLIFKRGMATFPRNSTLWSLSSSYTVTSSTELISFTLLQRNCTLL